MVHQREQLITTSDIVQREFENRWGFSKLANGEELAERLEESQNTPEETPAAKLTIWRQSMGYTQKELASILGCSGSMISRLESGKDTCDPHIVSTIKDVTGLEMPLRHRNLRSLHGHKDQREDMLFLAKIEPGFTSLRADEIYGYRTTGLLSNMAVRGELVAVSEGKKSQSGRSLLSYYLPHHSYQQQSSLESLEREREEARARVAALQEKIKKAEQDKILSVQKEIHDLAEKEAELKASLKRLGIE